MERFNRELLLTTSQVGDLLSVHPSTVKRWCNDGDLETDRTDGGHRRIHLRDALELAGARSIPTFLDPFDPYQGHVWTAVEEAVGGGFRKVHSLALGWLARGHIHRISWLFQELGRRDEIPFSRFCDEGVRGFMARVGEEWRDGRLRVGEEHLASQIVTEALLHLRHGGDLAAASSAASGDDRPRAVVGAMEGDQHHLGALCVRLVLEREGWDVFYLGPDVPVEDFAAVQRSFGATLLCLSFSPPATPADMKRAIRILGEFYAPARPYTLAIGGGMEAGPDDLAGLSVPFADVRVFGACGELEAALADGFATAELAGAGR